MGVCHTRKSLDCGMTIEIFKELQRRQTSPLGGKGSGGWQHLREALEQAALILLDHSLSPRIQHLIVDRIGRREQNSLDSVGLEPFDLGDAFRWRASDRK